MRSFAKFNGSRDGGRWMGSRWGTMVLVPVAKISETGRKFAGLRGLRREADARRFQFAGSRDFDRASYSPSKSLTERRPCLVNSGTYGWVGGFRASSPSPFTGSRRWRGGFGPPAWALLRHGLCLQGEEGEGSWFSNIYMECVNKEDGPALRPNLRSYRDRCTSRYRVIREDKNCILM